jgi:hypothetical protein
MQDIYVEDIGLDQNITYDDAEHEPELHFKTWIALGAMWCYNFVIVLALNSPAAIVCQERHSSPRYQLLTCLTGLVHRNKSRSPRASDLGCHRAHTSTMCPVASSVFRVRCLPDPQTHLSRDYCHLLHRIGYCSRISKHLQAHRRSVDDFIRVFLCPSRLLDPE